MATDRERDVREQLDDFWDRALGGFRHVVERFLRDGVDNEAGWPLYLQRYAALFERST